MDTIIVDDEEKALDMLQFYLENYFSKYTIIGRYTNVNDALEGILLKKPDVVFLDINMPSGSGIELLAKIKHLDCKIIFLTAHSKYAIEAIKHSAFDYLLKPLNLDELIRVDYKIESFKTLTSLVKVKKIKIKISNHVYLLDEDDITFASSEGNYTTIHLSKQSPIMISKNIKKIKDEYLYDLPFYRCHQSFIVNLKHILSFSNYEIYLTNGNKISLSNKKYDELAKLLSSV